MSFDEYNKAVKKRAVIFWIILIAYISVVWVMPFLIEPLSNSETTATVLTFAYIAVLLGGAVVIFTLFLYPLFRGIDPPGTADGRLLGELLDQEELPEVYHERCRSFLIFEFIIPFIILLAGFTVYLIINNEVGATIYLSAILLIMFAVLYVFGFLDVSATKDHLGWHFGPMGNKIPLKDIKTIRSVPVHPLRDFKGWGIRPGADGAWGYISRGKVGVRVELANTKRYVITVSDPETLVRFVRSHRDRKKKGTRDEK